MFPLKLFLKFKSAKNKSQLQILSPIKNCFQKKKNSAFKIRFIIYNVVK